MPKLNSASLLPGAWHDECDNPQAMLDQDTVFSIAMLDQDTVASN